VAAFTSYRQEESQRRAATEAAKKGTVRTKYDYCMTELTRLLQVEVPEDAPEVWHKLASSSSKTSRAIIQSAISRTCQTLGLPPLDITPSLAMTLATPPDYRTDDLDHNLHQGWTLWGTLAKSGTGKNTDRGIAHAYDLAQTMGSSLSYSDTQKFLTTDGTVLVATPAHAVATLKGGYAVSYTFLEKDHPITIEFSKLTRWLDSNQLLLQQALDSFPTPLAFLTAMVFYFHKDLSSWLNYQLDSNSRVPPPNFLEWSFCLNKKDQCR